MLRRRPQPPVIVASSTSFFLSRSRQATKPRRRLPSHASTPSRHHDTTCATLHATGSQASPRVLRGLLLRLRLPVGLLRLRAGLGLLLLLLALAPVAAHSAPNSPLRREVHRESALTVQPQTTLAATLSTSQGALPQPDPHFTAPRTEHALRTSTATVDRQPRDRAPPLLHL